MTDKENLEAEILGRIIKKAEANGYKSEIENPVSADQQAKLIIQHAHLYQFLYKHPYKFAKAFWGEEDHVLPDGESAHLWEWQWHLQQMVLEENPIEYLEKFL